MNRYCKKPSADKGKCLYSSTEIKLMKLLIVIAVFFISNLNINAALKTNSNDVSMFYMSSDTPIETTCRLAAYYNKSGQPVDWLLNGLVLFTMEITLYDYPTQADVDKYINDLFKSQGVLEKLNALVGDLKISLNDPDYKFNIFFLVPFTDSAPGGNIVNNIDAIMANWNSNSYPHLDLIGFYWGYTETFQLNIPITNIQTAAQTVHGYNLKLLMIPYSGADMSLFPSSGVDYCTQQPNYAFTGVYPPPTSWFKMVNDNMLAYGTHGAELEIANTCNNGLTIYENSLHYYEAARNYKWNDGFMTTYYENIYIEQYCTSPDPDMRRIYDKLYRYVSSNLRGEWRFYEQSGLSTADSSEKSNDGTLYSAQWDTDGIAGCLRFDGNNDYVLIPDDSTLDINGAITIEAWIKPEDISKKQAIISRNEYGKRLFLTAGGNIEADFGGTIQNTANSPVIQGQWNHVVYTCDGSVSRIFVNGAEASTGNAGADFASNQEIFIGKTRWYASYFEGLIDEVKIYSRCLSVSEIENNYKDESSLVGLAGRWSFGEALDGYLAYDTSENRNDGEKKNGVLISKEGIDESLYFDGIDDYVLIPDSNSLDISGELSVSVWIKPEDTSVWHAIISRDEYDRRLLIAPGGNIQADFGGNIQVTTSSPVINGQWNHVVYTSNGTNSTIYVNGTAVLSGTGGAEFASDKAVFIGKTWGDNFPFKGEIDEVKIYSKVLNFETIVEEYSRELKQTLKAAEWKLDEAAGDKIGDSSENCNTGDIHGAAWVSGISGNALSFDGIDDYVKLNTLLSTSSKISNQITIEAWVKPLELTADQTIIDGFSIAAGGSVKVYSGGITHLTSGMVVKTGQWNHIVYTSDGASSTVYVNGEKQNSGNCKAEFYPHVMGNNLSLNSPFKGEIDEVSIYRRVLTDDEILNNYQKMQKCCAEWFFDENSGTITEDTSPNNNNGTITGAQWSTGKIGSALSFDGVDDYVSIPDDPSLDIDGAMSIEVWIKPEDTSTWHAVISRDEYDRRLLIAPGGNIQADFGGNIQITTSSPVMNGQWNHVVYTSNGTNSSIFVNGVEELTGNGGAYFISNKEVFIGKTWGGNYPFKGIIDEVKIYNKKLTAAEVITKYENVLNARAEWLFDENSGTSVADTSQYNNTGTISGAQWTTGKVGSGLLFDGVDDYVEITDNPSLDIDGAITIDVWIKPEDTSVWQAILSRDEYDRRLLIAPGGNIQADFGGTVQTTSGYPIIEGQWNHVIYTSNGTNSIIYVNGVEVLNGNGGAYFSSESTVFIGKTWGGNFPFKGIIDEVNIYAKFLPQF